MSCAVWIVYSYSRRSRKLSNRSLTNTARRSTSDAQPGCHSALFLIPGCTRKCRSPGRQLPSMKTNGDSFQICLEEPQAVLHRNRYRPQELDGSRVPEFSSGLQVLLGIQFILRIAGKQSFQLVTGIESIVGIITQTGFVGNGSNRGDSVAANMFDAFRNQIGKLSQVCG